MIFDSYLLEQLESNSNTSSIEVDLWSTFKKFRADVAPELSQTEWLFPEFTPHDEGRHIRSLLRLTDMLLGETLISRLNVCEQFILACSLYGHDWGMAVSRDERDKIFSLIGIGKSGVREFSLLPNEADTFSEFLKERNLKVVDVTDEKFRDYVRLTHPARAKSRIEAWFRDGERRLGEALGIVSEGHWYDIEQVRNLPRSESVHGHTVNLSALTGYIRVIDLLDIAENRTPYKLWKFINPRDPFSEMEWKKHEALSPVQVEESQSGSRVVLVHGSTADYRVEANLEDMRLWCEMQFNENRSLFAELGQPYDPSLSWIEWKVKASGFTPAHVRFDFDRDRTFDLIAAEIYDNDSFVFLRELIQNAIDAVVLRKELTSKIDKDMEFSGGVIEIEIGTDTDDGTPTQIRVKDNGVGMDLDKVQRYLSVAGRSYYRSDEFEKLNLSMSPISRFGIGILSCFMVANELKILTRKDKLISNSQGLEIEIPHLRHQFHIRNTSQNWTGTEVTVFLNIKKLDGLASDSLTVGTISDFVRTIAGLSPVPIHISHNGKIVHELSAVTFDEKQGFVDGDDQHKFPIDRVAIFGLLNSDNANAIFGADNRLVMKEHIGNFDMEVDISYLMRGPHITKYPTQMHNKHLFHDSATNSMRVIHWKSKDQTKSSSSGSWNTNLYERVFMNGILVPNVDLKINWGGRDLPMPRVTVNIKPVDGTTRTSVSRQTINRFPQSIADAITDAFDSQICDEYESKFEASSAKERVLLLSEVLCSRHTTPIRLSKRWNVKLWPVPYFSSLGVHCELVQDLKANYDALEVLPFRYLVDNFNYFANGSQSQAWMNGVAPMISEFSAELPDRMVITSDLIFSNYGGQIIGDVGYSGLSLLFRGGGGFHESSSARVVMNVAGEHWMLSHFTTEPMTTRYPDHLCKLVPSWDGVGRATLQFKELVGCPDTLLGLIEIDTNMMGDSLLRVRRLILNLDNKLCQCFISATKEHVRAVDSLAPIEAEQLKEFLTSFPMMGLIPAYNQGGTESHLLGWLMSYCQAATSKGWLDSGILSDALQDKDLIPVHGSWM